MKKIIMCVLAGLAALAIQAASCTWSASAIALAKAGDSPSDYTAYLCDAAITSLSSMQTALDNGDLSLLSTGDTVVDSVVGLGGTTSARIKATTIDPFATVNNSNPKENDSFTFYVIIMNGDNSSYYSIAENTARVSGDLSLSMTFGSQGNSTTAWKSASDAPEPTSGLLLLVGGAFLALRRKQK